MFGIGMPELVIILVIGLIIMGPKKLPEIARAIGKGITQFRRAMNAVDDDGEPGDGPAPGAEESASPEREEGKTN